MTKSSIFTSLYLLMIFVSGSIAVDTIINTFGTFDQNKSENWFNLSLYSESLENKNGWAWQNIAYGLGLLGLRDKTIFVWTVGQDFVFPDLQKYINYEYVTKDDQKNTAHAYIIHDANQSQINIFYPGAMSSRVYNISQFDYKRAIISPNDKEAMKFHIKALKQMWAKTIFDPGQSLIIWNADEILEVAKHSDFLICNEHEFGDILQKIWTDEIGVLDIFGHIVVTMWGKWARYISHDLDIAVDGIKVANVIDSSGAWDAFRGWFLFGLYNWLSIEESLNKWCALWASCVANMWSLGYLV